MGAVAPSSSGSSSGSGSYSYSGMDKKKSDFRVDGLDEVVPAYAKFDGDMYAGTLPMDNGNGRRGEIMFWLFAPSKPAVRDTLVMWLNGGPGCSSFNAGVMMETAPVMIQTRDAGYCCLKTDEPLVYNPSAWTEATAMLYIEQPVGVGFSNGGPEPQDEDDVSGDVYAFLVNFYRVFDDFQPKRLFIVGESYAGMYVPAIARRVYLETEKLMRGDTHNRVKMNLAGTFSIFYLRRPVFAICTLFELGRDEAVFFYPAAGVWPSCGNYLRITISHGLFLFLSPSVSSSRHHQQVLP